MKAFINTPITKERFLFHLKEHQKQDAFISGTYGNSLRNGTFEGCAVGCSIRSIALELKEDLDLGNHKLYEKYLGVPDWIARLEDTLFENLSEERQKTFPVEFGEAVNEGADLDKIKVPFIVYILNENLKTLDSLKVDKEKDNAVFNSIELVRKATFQMIKAQKSGDKEKIEAARSAAWLAGLAAGSAAWLAAGSAVGSAVGLAASEKYADKLLELMRGCN